jgi:hypothetical protein
LIHHPWSLRQRNAACRLLKRVDHSFIIVSRSVCSASPFGAPSELRIFSSSELTIKNSKGSVLMLMSGFHMTLLAPNEPRQQHRR